jgi:hypothetical protein
MSYILSAITDHLYTLTEPVTTTPFTISAWFKSTATGANYVITSIDTPNSSGYQILGTIEASGGVGGTPVRAYNYNGSSFGVAASTTGFASGTWYHACGVFTSATSRAAFIDGGSKGTDTTNIVGVPSELVIGRRRRNNAIGTWNANSLIAEVAVWSSALSDADVASLGGGASPLGIDSGNLAAYWPLTTVTQLTDSQGSNDLTDGDAATWSADHPTISDISELSGTIAAAASVTGNLSVEETLELSGTISGASTVGPASLGFTEVPLSVANEVSIKRIIAIGNNRFFYEDV